MAMMSRTRALLAAALLTLLAQPVERAQADAVTDWNVVALDATAVPPNSILQSRVLAIVHGAIYDVVHAVEPKGAAYAVDLKAPAGTSVDAAIAAAAHGVLVRLANAQRPMLDAARNAALSKIPDSQAKDDGIRVGTQVADATVALRSKDQSGATVVFSPRPGPGLYQLTPPLHMPAILAHWGGVTPFVLRSRDSLGLKGPPSITSAEFARDFDEVKSVGARDSTTRTADQTAAAIFWTVQTGAPWYAAARAASAAKGLSVSENARLFAILAMATADSQIVGFDEKYKRAHWRPITVIRAAADLDIGTLKGDRNWEPLLVTPPQPDYPSAHPIFSGAAEAVLRAYFGSDAVQVSVAHPAPFGVVRSWRRFSEMSAEVDNARVWGGIHFRTADTDGRNAGRRIGAIVFRDFPKPPTN
jgi:hypothetical protein